MLITIIAKKDLPTRIHLTDFFIFFPQGDDQSELPWRHRHVLH